ncbi:MAG: amino acid ABC transporter substrate-binding protein [Polyangiales bacterium]
MKRRFLCSLVASSLALSSACGSKGDANTRLADDKIVLGASLSATGSLAREGALTREGYELCASVINERGGVPVGDKKLKVEVRFQDDTSKPDTAGQLIERFNDQGVKLILGPYGSATTEAAAAVVERNGQLMTDSAGADDKIFEKNYKRTFAVLSPATQYVTSMVLALHELAEPRPKRLAFIAADDGFSKTALRAGIAKARELGFEVVAEEYVPSGTSDVSSALTKIKPQKPDVIFSSAHFVEAVAVVKQSSELGFDKVGFAETIAPPTADFVKSLGEAADGVLGSTQWTDSAAGKDKWFGTARDYAATFSAKHGGRAPAYHNAQATAACLALVLAVEAAGTTDAAKVRDELAKLDVQTFFGPIKFNPQGMNVVKPMSVVQVQGGKPVAVWPKDAAAAKLKWPPRG